MDGKTKEAREAANIHYTLYDTLELQIPQYSKTHLFFYQIFYQIPQYSKMRPRHQNSLDMQDVHEVLNSHES